MTKTLVVVGNAEPRENCSKLIDECDVVIRFNCAPFFEKNKTGLKTTILCLFGVPYPRPGEIPRLNADIVMNCQTIWVESPAFFDPLVRRYEIPPQKITLMNLRGVNDDHAIDGAERIKKPSSGFLVLRHLVNSAAFEGYRKYVCRFEWQGSHAHLWEMEKRQVGRYLELGFLKILDGGIK
jgi:hypothetical protein